MVDEVTGVGAVAGARRGDARSCWRLRRRPRAAVARVVDGGAQPALQRVSRRSINVELRNNIELRNGEVEDVGHR